MKIPQIKNPGRYVGLYVVDFGEHSGVGYTAEEVAELLESEKFKDIMVFKIYKAYPDGKFELKGVPAQTFQLESGLFFYAKDLQTAKEDFDKLGALAVSSAPPCRAKVNIAKYTDEKFVAALIYPAEYDEDISAWLLENDYKTSGTAQGGISATGQYYDHSPEILERHQLFGRSENESLSGQELLACIKTAVVR